MPDWSHSTQINILKEKKISEANFWNIKKTRPYMFFNKFYIEGGEEEKQQKAKLSIF